MKKKRKIEWNKTEQTKKKEQKGGVFFKKKKQGNYLSKCDKN